MVIGNEMDTMDIINGGQALIQKWEKAEPKSRDLCDWRYGYKYEDKFVSKEWSEEVGMSVGDIRLVMKLGTYRFVGIELSEYENELLDRYERTIKYIHEQKRKAAEDKKRRSKDEFK